MQAKSLATALGDGAPKGFKLPPAMQAFTVLGIFLATMRASSQGSSFRSRTNFLSKIPLIGTSTAANPAWPMASATAAIMPVRMPDAHRLCDPSRNVVSMKCTSMASSLP